MNLTFQKYDPAIDDYHIIPEAPGNYLIALKPGCRLPDCPIDYVIPEYLGLRIIYTGVASLNLRQRDFRAHFKGTAGRSTLRKSLGCFWGYKFIPRDKHHPDNGKVMYSASDEAALSDWMKENLLLLFCANDNFDNNEDIIIKELNPPLNLSKNHNAVNAEFRQWLTSQRTR